MPRWMFCPTTAAKSPPGERSLAESFDALTEPKFSPAVLPALPGEPEWTPGNSRSIHFQCSFTSNTFISFHFMSFQFMSFHVIVSAHSWPIHSALIQTHSTHGKISRILHESSMAKNESPPALPVPSPLVRPLPMAWKRNSGSAGTVECSRSTRWLMVLRDSKGEWKEKVWVELSYILKSICICICIYMYVCML